MEAWRVYRSSQNGITLMRSRIRFRIRIKVKSRIRISIKVKRRIRIPVMRTRNNQKQSVNSKKATGSNSTTPTEIGSYPTSHTSTCFSTAVSPVFEEWGVTVAFSTVDMNLFSPIFRTYLPVPTTSIQVNI
jgi:hypothetical protein